MATSSSFLSLPYDGLSRMDVSRLCILGIHMSTCNESSGLSNIHTYTEPYILKGELSATICAPPGSWDDLGIEVPAGSPNIEGLPAGGSGRSGRGRSKSSSNSSASCTVGAMIG